MTTKTARIEHDKPNHEEVRKAIKLEGAALDTVKAFVEADRKLITEGNALVDQINAKRKERDDLQDKLWADIEEALPELKDGNWRLDVEHLDIGVAVVAPAEKDEGMPDAIKQLLERLGAKEVKL